MREIRMEDVGAAVLEKVKEQKISIADLARAADVEYNTVKSFVEGRTIPHLDTLQKILWATGYEFLEVLDPDRKPVYLEDGEDFNIRKFRRLNEYHKGLIQTSLDAMLILQEKEKRTGKGRQQNIDNKITD